MMVTFEGDKLKEEDVVVRDSSGRVVKLELPEKLVMIANHQVCAMVFGSFTCLMLLDVCGLAISVVLDLQIEFTQGRFDSAQS
jgi:hypothetical protein